MSTLLFHAKNELDAIGLSGNNDMDKQMRTCVLEIIQLFADQEHTMFSISYAIELISKLLKFEPLCPLTGEDSEWVEVSAGLFQNKRCGRVFKENVQAYDIDGTVFYNIEIDCEGEEFKSYFTNRNSRTPVTFPYIPYTIYLEQPQGE